MRSACASRSTISAPAIPISAICSAFPLDKLKIDRSFVAALGSSANGGVIIQAIVALGRALGLSVLVEGVETEQQRVLLRLAGCDEMQGFLFARPAPAKAIDRLLAQMRSGGGPRGADSVIPSYRVVADRRPTGTRGRTR